MWDFMVFIGSIIFGIFYYILLLLCFIIIMLYATGKLEAASNFAH